MQTVFVSMYKSFFIIMGMFLLITCYALAGKFSYHFSYLKTNDWYDCIEIGKLQLFSLQMIKRHVFCFVVLLALLVWITVDVCYIIAPPE